MTATLVVGVLGVGLGAIGGYFIGWALGREVGFREADDAWWDRRREGTYMPYGDAPSPYRQAVEAAGGKFVDLDELEPVGLLTEDPPGTKGPREP